jgi:hypothetical protein
MAALLIGLLSGTAAAYTDIPGHWAETAINEWSTEAAGILRGYDDSTFGPNDAIKGNDLDLVLARLLGKEEAAWADSVPLTREAAAKAVATALGLAPVNAPASLYADDAYISADLKGYVYALKEAGMQQGVGDNKFSPKSSFTRGEILQTIYNGISAIIDSSVSNVSYEKSVVVRKPGLTLANASVGGNVIAGYGIGGGSLTLDAVTVSGDIAAFGGGDSIILKNSTAVTGTFKNLKTAGDLRLSVDSSSSLSKVTAGEDSKTIISGKVSEIDIPADAAGSAITLTASARADILTAAAASTVSAEKGALITAATVTADNVNISGSGKFTTLTISSAVNNPGTISSATTGKIINNSGADVKNELGAVVAKSGDSKTLSAAATGGGGGASGYPVSTGKFTLAKSASFLPTESTVAAAFTQTGDYAYSAELSGSVTAQIVGDNAVSGGDFMTGFVGAEAYFENNKSGYFAYITLSGLLPANTQTTIVTKNDAYEALYNDAALALMNSYNTTDKTYTTITLSSADENATFIIWSGDSEITATVTNGAAMPYTLTIKFPALTFKTPTLDITADTTIDANTPLTVGSGATTTVTDSNKIEIENGGTLAVEDGGTLDVAGTLEVKEGGTIAIEANGAIAVESNGAIAVAADGALDVAGTLEIKDGGALTVAANGTLEVKDGGKLDIVQNGTVEITGDLVVAKDGEVVLAGEVEANGSLKVTGTLTVEITGAIGGTGTLIIDEDALIDVGGETKADALFANIITPAIDLGGDEIGMGVKYEKTGGGFFILATGAKIKREPNAASTLNGSLPAGGGYSWVEEGAATGVYTLTYTAPTP